MNTKLLNTNFLSFLYYYIKIIQMLIKFTLSASGLLTYFFASALLFLTTHYYSFSNENAVYRETFSKNVIIVSKKFHCRLYTRTDLEEYCDDYKRFKPIFKLTYSENSLKSMKFSARILNNFFEDKYQELNKEIKKYF